MGLLLSFVAVAGPVDAVAKGLMARSPTIDVNKLGEQYEIDSIHDCLEAVFEDRGPLADAIIYGGRSLDSDGRDWTVLDAADLPPLVDLMTRMDFDALLEERLAVVEELYGGTLEEDDRTGMRDYFDDLLAFYARADGAGLSVIKWV